MDMDEGNKSSFDTRQVAAATDFELEDYWDEGEVLNGREKWPVCVTLNLVCTFFCPILSTPWSEANVGVTASATTLPRRNITRRGCYTLPTSADIL